MLSSMIFSFSRILCALPEDAGRNISVGIGMIASQFALGERRFLTETIDRVFHRLQYPLPMPLPVMVNKLFMHFSQNILEILRAPRISEESLKRNFHFHDQEHLDRALARKKGVILLVPHLGNWELLGSAIAHRGYPLHSFFMAQKENDFGSLLDHFRGFWRIVLHDRDRGGIGALRALKAGEILGMIADQDGGSNAVYADFLGHWVSIPAGPANWSLKTGAALIPLYSLRRGNSSHFDAFFFPPLNDSETGTHEEKVIQRTDRLIRWMESVILKYPHQYLWFYDRFKPRHEGHLAKLKRAGLRMRHGETVYGVRSKDEG